MGINEARQLFRAAGGAARGVRTLQGPLEWDFLVGQIERLFAEHYALGEVVGIEQIVGGYENLSFAVWTRPGGGEQRHFLRKYRRATIPSEIEFEHAFLQHLGARGFLLAPQPVVNRAGGSWTSVAESVDGQTTTRQFAVFSFLDGDDRYEWFENPVHEAELASAAEVLAELHSASRGFAPEGLCRLQEPVLEYTPGLVPVFEECAARAGKGAVDRLFVAHLDEIREVIARSCFAAESLAEMPCFALHADYHSGNLKYDGPSVVGVFDFDDAKVDYRVFDIALALANMCTSWDAADDGDLRFDKIHAFVDAYQRAARRLDWPGPLNHVELRAMWRMLANANLNLLSWEVIVYFADQEAVDGDYLRWVRHHLRAMRFIETHRAELEETLGLGAPISRAGHRGGVSRYSGPPAADLDDLVDDAEPPTTIKFSLGLSVLAAHGLSQDAPRPLVSHAYTSASVADGHLYPHHLTPLPETDWFHSILAVASLQPGEDILTMRAQPGLLDAFEERGILDRSRSTVIEIDPLPGPLGFPFTDPLTLAAQAGSPLAAAGHHARALVASFPTEQVRAAAMSLGLSTPQESLAALSNDKAAFRASASRWGYRMLPGLELRDDGDLQAAVDEFGRAAHGAWMKLAHGAGGDTIRRLPPGFDLATAKVRLAELRAAAAGMFAQSDFGAGAEARFWPRDALLPRQTRVVVEAHAADRGRVLIDGSAVLLVDRHGDHQVPAMHHQLVTAAGGFEGMRPLNPRPALRAALQEQFARVARYCAQELHLFGLAGVDFFVVDEDGEGPTVYLVELNGRPTASAMAQIVADKLGAPYFTGMALTAPADVVDVASFERLAGPLSSTSVDEGTVLLQSLAAQWRRRPDGELELLRPSRSLHVIVASKRDQAHVTELFERLRGRGFTAAS